MTNLFAVTAGTPSPITTFVPYFTGAMAFFALASCILSYLAYRKAGVKSRADVYLQLRDRFHPVAAELPTNLHDSNLILQKGSKEWTSVERYWLCAFDEWLVTTQLHSRDWRKLWDTFYADAIQSAIQSREMRRVLLTMLDGKISFGAYKRKFRNAMEDLWEKQHSDKDIRYDLYTEQSVSSRLPQPLQPEKPLPDQPLQAV